MDSTHDLTVAAPAGRRVPPPRAVVGVGESAAGAAALAWALDLCRTRGWRLDVVTAWPDVGEPFVHDVPGHSSAPRARAVRAQDAALHACGVTTGDPGLRALVVNADPVDALVEHSRDARLLVVGLPDTGRSSSAGHPPIGASCVARAECAVVVVGERAAPDRGDEDAPRQAMVTAGSR